MIPSTSSFTPKYALAKPRPTSNSIKITKNTSLNLSSTQKSDIKVIKFESATPKQSLSKPNPEKPLQISEKLTAAYPTVSSGLTIKLKANFNKSYGNISREEIKSARPRKKISLGNSRRLSQTYTDPDFMISETPISPIFALKQFSHFLSKFEIGEISAYNEIYYLGLKAQKIQGDTGGENYGFDDQRSDYKLIQGDHISYRYEIQQMLGKGSFGQVCKCYDHKSKQQVAIKIIRNEKRFHRQGGIEVKVLDHIKTHDPDSKNSMVTMLESFNFRQHLCLSFELLSINLYELIKSNNLRGFSSSLIKRFALQILNCLCFLRENKIIHCDLKPENILLKQLNKSSIKVIDFGSSCFETEKIYTYIQSRFYRAPEIILGIPYTTGIDMWSFGCILAELSTGCPLFPGESEAEQLLCMMELKGLPPQEVLMISTKRSMFFDGGKPKVVPNSRGKKRLPGSKSLEERLKISDEGFLDLIKKTLEWDPKKRITPREALQHSWLHEQNSRLKTATTIRTFKIK
ncbi:hypothetical protein SteCoe_153 [Stentor coeruleus]|uniref:dual-specificity kinase n=1 Tax=Stentor coeruleus TaxID=5963 RepID=A0A1R2D4K8_9CILI|nr:hypothetical protein SteCoe_153 [Stentor coeruleus]